MHPMAARRTLIVLLAGLLAVGLLDLGADAKRPGRKVATKKPPYKNGPAGGDEFNDIERDRQSGHIRIVRLFPEPGAFGCPDSHAAWATFEVTHRLRKRRLRHIALKYSNADMDGYTWITATVKYKRRSIGYRSYQGPVVGESGTVRVKLNRWPRRGRIKIQFGLQVSSNCPQAEASQVTIPKINIRMGRLRR